MKPALDFEHESADGTKRTSTPEADDVRFQG